MRWREGLAFGLFPSAALAHGDGAGDGGPGWSLDPFVMALLGLLLLVFLVGKARLGHRSQVPRRKSWLFVAGLAVMAGALLSPLHEAGERSFALHMAEHELIMLVATLLLAASGAGGVLAWGLPATIRRGLGGRWTAPLSYLWRRLTEPLTATLVQVAVLWAWHAPALFDRALESRSWHILQHGSFVVASLLFWVAMLDRRRGSDLLAAACLFLTSMVEGGLGALMTFSNSPWYRDYVAMGVTGIGLDPVTDQRLAGLLMWIPGGLLHGIVAIAILHRWLASARNRDAGSRPLTRYR